MNNTSYVRFCFAVEPIRYITDKRLDKEIVENQWVTLAFLESKKDMLRSNMVLRCINDYLAGIKYPIEILKEIQL